MTPTMASSSSNNNSQFAAAWTNFYRTADLVLSDTSQNSKSNTYNSLPTSTKRDRSRRHQRHRPRSASTTTSSQQQQQHHVVNIQSILQSLSKLLSAVDAPSKVYACQNGALRIIVRGCDALLHVDDTFSSAAILGTTLVLALKVIQTCVFKNTVGRNLCRSEDVLGLLERIMNEATKTKATSIPRDAAELVLLESVTTLAAVCLGNDLNALVASIQFKHTMESALQFQKTTRGTIGTSSSTTSRLDQMLTYLQKLFRVIQSEQQSLLENFCPESNYDNLLGRIERAEKELHTGIQLQANHQWSQAETAFSRALDLVIDMAPHTNLVDGLQIDLLDRRSTVRLELEDWQGVLDDLEACSSDKRNNRPFIQLTAALIRQADAYIGLKCFQKAQKALESAMQLDARQQEDQQSSQHQENPTRTLTQKWNQLQLAKSRASRADTRTKQQRKKQPMKKRAAASHEINTLELDTVLARTGKHYNSDMSRQHQHQQHRRQQPIEEEFIDATPAAKPGTYVNCLYGTGIVQEVRKCGTTKIKLNSWSPGKQEPTAYLMPEFYTVVAVSE